MNSAEVCEDLWIQAWRGAGAETGREGHGPIKSLKEGGVAGEVGVDARSRRCSRETRLCMWV